MGQAKTTEKPIAREFGMEDHRIPLLLPTKMKILALGA
jgi:hypothetical protein